MAARELARTSRILRNGDALLAAIMGAGWSETAPDSKSGGGGEADYDLHEAGLAEICAGEFTDEAALARDQNGSAHSGIAEDATRSPSTRTPPISPGAKASLLTAAVRQSQLGRSEVKRNVRPLRLGPEQGYEIQGRPLIWILRWPAPGGVEDRSGWGRLLDRQAEPIFDRGGVQRERFEQHGRGDALGGDFQHAVVLMADQRGAMAADLANVGPGDQQMHEEVFHFDRVVGEVGGDDVIVLRTDGVIDGVCFKHGLSSPVGDLSGGAGRNLVGLRAGADPLETFAGGNANAPVALGAGGVKSVLLVALVGDDGVGNGLARRGRFGGAFGRGDRGGGFCRWIFHSECGWSSRSSQSTHLVEGWLGVDWRTLRMH